MQRKPGHRAYDAHSLLFQRVMKYVEGRIYNAIIGLQVLILKAFGLQIRTSIGSYQYI